MSVLKTPRWLDYYETKLRVQSRIGNLEFSRHDDMTLRQRERVDAQIQVLKWVINIFESDSIEKELTT